MVSVTIMFEQCQKVEPCPLVVYGVIRMIMSKPLIVLRSKRVVSAETILFDPVTDLALRQAEFSSCSHLDPAISAEGCLDLFSFYFM